MELAWSSLSGIRVMGEIRESFWILNFVGPCFDLDMDALETVLDFGPDLVLDFLECLMDDRQSDCVWFSAGFLKLDVVFVGFGSSTTMRACNRECASSDVLLPADYPSSASVMVRIPSASTSLPGYIV